MLRKLFRRLHSSASLRSGSPCRKRSRQLSVEALEARQLLSCNPVISGGVLYVNGDNAATTVGVEHVNANTTQVAWTSSTGNGRRVFGDNTFSSIRVNMGSAADSIAVVSLPFGKPTTVDGGGGLDFVQFGLGDTSGILSPVTVVNAPSFNTILVRDGDSSVIRNIVHDTFTDGNGVSWGVLRGMTPGGDVLYKNTDTASVEVQTGLNGASVSVLRTQRPLTLFGNARPDSFDVVQIGHDGTVQDIQNTVNVKGSYQRTLLYIYDYNDPVASTATLDHLIAGPTGTGRIVGLAPGDIQFDYFGVGYVEIYATPGSVVNVRATGTKTSIGGSGIVNVGDGGRLEKIQGDLNVLDLVSDGTHFPTTVFVDDSADTVYHPDVLLYGLSGVAVENLAPARITVFGESPSTPSQLRVRTGPGGVGVTAHSFFLVTTLMTSGPADTVTVSNNGVADINAPLFIDSEQGSVALVVDDSKRPATFARTVTHDTFRDRNTGVLYGSICGFTARGEIAYRVDRVPTVRLIGGPGDNTFSVLGMGANALTVETGGFDDTVFVGYPGYGLDSIRGTLTVDGGAGFNTLLLDDSANPAGQTFTVTATTVTRSALNPLTYRNFNALNLNAGGGNDTVAVEGTAPGLIVYADGGAGANTLVGPDADAAWAVRLADDCTLNSAALGAPVYFSRFGSLQGGSGSDVFAFEPDGSLSGTLDGGGGRNRLDYSARGDFVRVILPLGLATATAGIAGIQDVYGGQGGNVLVGDDQPNVLRGGAGRDVLIGGAGGDVLHGGGGEDLLVGGWTDYDRDEAALLALWTTWNRTDLAYKLRVKLLQKGDGTGPALTGQTVHDDGAANQLDGEAGLDWYFEGAADVILGLEKGEIVKESNR